jgi:YD repeat-containing protein
MKRTDRFSVATCFIIIVASYCLFVQANAFAQSQTAPYVQGDQADISLLNINSGNLPDRGSAFVGSSFIKGAVNVSDYSGNMTIGHSMDINYPNDLKTKLTLTFNSNACHAYFEDFVGRYNTEGLWEGNGIGVRENSVNAALWIFGVNGIALQTTNFEKNFFIGSTDVPSQEDSHGYNFTGTQVPLLATGYQYTNDIRFPGDSLEQVRLGVLSTQYPVATRKDEIRIMNSEGSVLTLENPTYFSDADELGTIPCVENLTGMYYDADEQSNGYAIVSWMNNNFGLRKIYYKPGDGLTYYFEEEYVNYQQTLNTLTAWGGRLTNPPKIAYLKYIQSQNGDKIVFTYDYLNIFNVANVTHGRKYLKEIQYYNSNGSPIAGTEILFTYTITNGVYQINIQNNLSGESYTVKLNYSNPHFNNLNEGGFDNIVRDSNVTCSNIMQVSSITSNDNSNKSVSFSYGNHQRRYTYGALECSSSTEFPNGCWNYSIWNYYYLQYPTKILTSRTVLNGEKNDFDYWTDYELESNIPLYDVSQSYSVDPRYIGEIGSGNSFCSGPWPGINGWPGEEYLNWGYYINAYSNAPSNAYYSNRWSPDLFYDAPFQPSESSWDSAASIWYRYFEAYNFRNMNNTMRDNYAATMVSRITNSIYNGSGGYSPIDSVRYDYTWDKTEYNGNSSGTGQMYSGQMYNDMSPKITNIKTIITTTNLTSETSSAASNKYTETKNYELLKVKSKIRASLYKSVISSFANNYAVAQKLVSDAIRDANGNVLQSIQYNYNVNDAEIKNFWGQIVNRAWQYYYDLQSPTDLTLASKVVQYGGYTKATVYTYNQIKQYQYFFWPSQNYNLFGDSCLVKNLLVDSTITVDQSGNMLEVCKVNHYSEQFGINSSNSAIDPSVSADNVSYVYRPTLPTEQLTFVAKGTGGTLGRKSRTVNIYSTTNDVTYGKLYQQVSYGATDDAPVTTTYSYNTGGNYPGYLSRVTYDNGSSVQYVYSGDVGTIYGSLFCTNGNTLTGIPESQGGLQPEPFETIKYHDRKSASSFTDFDGKGNLVYSLDEHGYYSCNLYDGIGRIQKQFTPGSFNANVHYLPLNNSFVSDNSMGTVLYQYNDNLWTPQVTTTAFLNHNTGASAQTLSKFDPSQLAYENYAIDGTQILKSQEKINYLGKKWYSQDGDGNNAYYYYDSYLNLSQTRFTGNSTSVPSKSASVDYSGSSYFKHIRLTDENGNYQDNYYDLYGNIMESDKYLGSRKLATKFTYDGLGRLQTVTTPENKVTTYTCDSRGNISSRTTPDAGTTQYLYDKYGNVRFILDANHASSSVNPGTIVSNVGSSSNSGGFTLNMPGNVTIGVYLLGGSSGTITITKNGATLCSATTTGGTVQNSIFLPKGNYTWSFTPNGGLSYGVTCTSTNEFVYNKYDQLNRLIETGEYQNNSAGGDFTQSNADNPSFPTSNTLVTKKFIYDVVSNNSLASGQRNVNGRLSEADAYRLGQLCSQTFYSYNEIGKAEWEVQSVSGLHPTKIYYWYDLQGNVIEKGVVDISGGNNMYTFYDYDSEGRLLRVWMSTDQGGASKVKEAEYSYYNSNRVKQLKLGSAPVQTIDYAYNNRGWLTSINNPDNMGSDKFAEILGYNTQAKVATVFPYTAQNNGNISWVAYRMAGVSNTYNSPYYGQVSSDYIGRVFTYDGLNRLTQAPLGYYYGAYWFSNGNYFSEGYSYTDDGNFNTLTRDNNNGSLTDNLTYNYASGTNKLNSITNSAGSGSSYSCDSNGNIISDSRSGIAFAIYDINDLPINVYKSGSAIQYWYDSGGNRIRRQYGGTDELYIIGKDGETEAVYNTNGALKFWNILDGTESIGMIEK